MTEMILMKNALMKTKDPANRILFEIKKLKNLTSEINLLKNQSDLFIEAIEYDREHVLFEVAANSCRQGQLVLIDGIIHIKDKKVDFQAHGKISNIAELGNNRLKVSVELHSYDKPIWEEFIQAASSEQTRVDTLFKSMKGDET